MRQTIRLTESELRQMIEESINEAMMDEISLRGIGRGLRNAFGGDAERAKQAAKGTVDTVTNGVQNVGKAVGKAVGKGIDTVSNGVQNVGKAVGRGMDNMQQSMDNMKKGFGKRVQAAKAGYQASENNSKIDRLIKDLTDLQSSGVLHGNAMTQSINALISQLKQAKGRNNSSATAFRNDINK